MADIIRHTDQEGALKGRHPMTREQIARRTVTRDEVAMWAEQTKRDSALYKPYWESKEVVQISEAGDDHLIFAGRMDVYTAKVWTFLDPSIPHNAYILHPDEETKYDLGEREGILLRFQFRGSMRVYNDKGLTAIVQGQEITVFQKADDVIIRITD